MIATPHFETTVVPGHWLIEPDHFREASRSLPMARVTELQVLYGR